MAEINKEELFKKLSAETVTGNNPRISPDILARPVTEISERKQQLFDRLRQSSRTPDGGVDPQKAANSLVMNSVTSMPVHSAYTNHDAIQRNIKNKRNRGILRSIKASHAIANKQVDKAFLGYQLLTGQGDPREIQNQINKIDREIQTEQQFVIKDEWYETALNNAATILPSMIRPVAEGTKVGLATGMAAGTTAAILGTAALPVVPEEIITVPAATATGFVAGTGIQATRIMSQIESGAAYLELFNLKDEQGNKINPQIAGTIAHSIGAVNALLEVVGLGAILKATPGARQLIREALNKSVSDTLRKGVLKELAFNYARQYPTMIAAETSTEILQEGVAIIGEEVAKNISGLDIPETTKQEVLSRLEEVATTTASGMAVLGIPGPSINTMVDRKSEVAQSGKRELASTMPPDKESDTATELLNTYERVKNLYFYKRDPRILNNTVQNKQLKRKLDNFVEPVMIEGQETSVNKKDLDTAILLYIDSLDAPEKVRRAYDYTVENPDGKFALTPKQMKLIDISRNLTERQRRFANDLRMIYAEMADEAIDADVIRNTLDTYTSRAWKYTSKEKLALEDTFKKSTRHARERVYKTIVDGWRYGRELSVDGAVDNLSLYKEELIRAMETKRFFNSMRDAKVSEEYVNKKGETKTRSVRLLSTSPKPGYSRVNLAQFTQYSPAQPVKQPLKRVLRTDDGVTLYETDIYAPTKVAKNLNNIFGRSTFIGLPGVETLTRTNAFMKKAALSVSLFHGLAFARSYLLAGYLGGYTLENKNPFTAYREGRRLIENLDETILNGVANGLTLDMTENWRTGYDQTVGKLEQIANKVKGGRAVFDNVRMVNDMMLNFLFSSFGVGLKAKAYVLEYQHQLKQFPDTDPDVVARRAAELINADFGGLHLERIGRNPTIQHIFRFLALAPDWTESNYRTVMGLFRRKGQDAAEVRQMYRDFWFRIATKGFVATTFLNIAMALSLGEDDELQNKYEDLQDFFNKSRKKYIAGLKRIGKGNVSRGYELIKEGIGNTAKVTDLMFKVDITPLYRYFGGDRHTRKYFSIYGHFLDPLKALADPPKVIRHKGSMFAGAAIELLTGEDWRGRPYTTLAQLLEEGKLTTFIKQYDPNGIPYIDGPMISYLISQAIGSTPIPVQNGVAYISGETEGFDAAARTIGLQVSTKHD